MHDTAKTISRVTWLVLAAAVIFCVQPIIAFGQVCSEGTGIPPFLSSGSDPNLLLILDNSGSMLDMAYVDPTTNCTDNTYDTTQLYVGNFDPDTWYTWNDGIAFWAPNQSYAHRSLVYDNGIVYQANCIPVAAVVPATCTSANVTKLVDDSAAIDWLPVPGAAKWTNSKIYVLGDIVRFGAQLYWMSYSSPTVIGANDPATDVAHWEPIEHTWRADKNYVAQDVVSYQGMLFQLKAGATLANTRTSSTIWDDLSGGSFPWVRVDEGAFAEVTDGSECTNTDYSNADVCIKVDETSTPKSVPKFSAKGKFLNWTAASKFDIQKNILTGGKFSNETQQLISENRGCAGSGFIKGVNVVDSANKTWVLSLRVGGPEYENSLTYKNDWVDTTDSTTRIEILALTDGPLLAGECQDAIDTILGGNPLQSASGDITKCLTPQRVAEDPQLADQRPMLNHALQFCEKYFTGGVRNLTAAIGECEDIYTGNNKNQAYYPWEINPYYGGYSCYGVYDPNVPEEDRLGFIGRCWDAALAASGVGCTLKPAVVPVPAAPWLHADGSLLRNNGGHLEYCTNTVYNPGLKTYSCKKVEDWVPVYENAAFIEYFGDPTCGGGGVPLVSGWVDPTGTCIVKGMEDYCDTLKIPEVIDPSDTASDTSDFLGAPATLIDSGVIAALGTDRALAVMKGYIKKTTAPKGILHQVAPNLRLGAMAFNNNGAATECLQADPADAVVEYCPDDIKDGARLISPILAGTAVTDTKGTADPTDDIHHIDNLTLAINSVRATTWTPLAEALYSAIGYYGQDKTRRLNSTDFLFSDEYVPYVAGNVYPEGTIASYNGKLYIRKGINNNLTWTPDKSMWWAEWAGTLVTDPVQYYCQSNNILVITEGASTADINPTVAAFATSTGLEDGTVLAAQEGECLDANGNSNLYGATYLDDLTYYAANAAVSDLYTTSPAPNKGQLQSSDGTWHDKENISTYIVTTGALRDEGVGECNPVTIMTNAAANGGTTLLRGENPAQLEANLRTALADIMSRASAGSAASVISSSRTGEGAAYQAIFWPKVSRGLLYDDLTWIGDVHSLFVDTKSQMFDDYSGGSTAITQNTAGRLWTEDINGNGQLDIDEDTNGNGQLDPGEDANGNGQLDTDNEDTNGNTCLDGDRRIFFYFDSTDQITKICFNDSVRTSLCVNDPTNSLCPAVCGTDSTNPICKEPVCDAALTDYCGTFTEPVTIKDFTNYLWSANQQLQEIDDANITLNRPVGADGRWDWTSSTAKRRYIFTWNDLNNDGLVDNGSEIIGLDKDTNYWEALSDLSVTDPTNYQHDILQDFQVADATEMNNLVNWLRGADELYESPLLDRNGDGTIDSNDFDPLLGDDINGNGKQDYVYRCRRYPDCDPTNTASNPEWRLGDIIHSTPTLIAQPFEGYHTIYRDTTYAWFVKKYRYRRQVVYFGANDGMLHAVNSGFFHDKTTSFCRELNPNYDITDTDTTNDNACLANGPELGDELWAYVPYNLAPHLKCLSDPEYNHKYFVDQKPRVTEVQIFAEEGACTISREDPACIHPYGWGTILIGAMRMGGAPMDANSNPVIDNRRFISSYFILDITDPERPPELLGEMTMTRDATGDPVEADLGYTVPSPTGVVMRENDYGRSTWYLIFGNGPENLSGENTKQGKLAVLPLNWLKGAINWDTSTIPPKPINYIANSRKAFKIPNSLPTTTNDGGIFLIPADASGNTSSFTGDLLNIDYNINAQVINNLGALYKSDAIYFGTVDGTGFTTYALADPLYNSLIPAATHWDGGGRLFRLITRNGVSGDPLQVSSPYQWQLTKLIDAKAPITAAPGIGWDGNGYWIYFGTGRFFDKDDKTDADQNYFFGIKEPVRLATEAEITAKSSEFKDKCAIARKLTWDTIDFDVTTPSSLVPNALPGSRGLFRADHVLVVHKDDFVLNDEPVAFCEPGYSGSDCPLSSLGTSLITPTGDTGGPYYAFNAMRDYIAGRCDATTTTPETMGIDGWYRKFPYPRERNIGQSTLLGGLTTFTTYQPFSDICIAEGMSFLYGVHFQTGTAWYEDVFGTYTASDKEIVRDRLSLGRGLATNPSLHVGKGPNDATAIIQTSTGEIVEVAEKDLPFDPKPPGKASWTDSCK